MKLSSQSIALCTFLFAAVALDAADASERKLLRNKKVGTDRKRNLFKVESALKDVVQVDDADLARALMGDTYMSMSMPSHGGSSSGSGSSSGGSSSSSGGSSSGGSSGSGGSSSGGSSGSGGSSSGESGSSGGPSGTTIGIETESGEAAPSEGSDAETVGSIDKSEPAQKTDDENDDSAAPSTRNIAVVAITTTAMAVPLLF